MPQVHPGTPLLSLLLFATFLLASCDTAPTIPSCTDSIGCVIIGPSEPVKIGVIQALSGKVAPLGLEQVRGMELALAQFDGKIAGHPLLIQTEDSGCTAEGGANAALKVVADPQTVAIFGTTCSSAAATAAKVMSDAGLTMISGNNSAPFLTSIGGKHAPNWQPGFFRTAPNEENAGKAAAVYAATVLKITRAAVINDGDIYTRGLTEGFTRAFTKLGGLIVLDASIDKGDDEMRPVLTAVADSRAELLFFPLFQPEGNHLLTQARENPRLADIILMSDGALIEQSFLSAMGNQARGMYFVGPSHAGTLQGNALAEAYQKRFDTAPATNYYQSAYDAVVLLFQALERTARHRPDGGLLIGREALRQQLYGVRGFQGVTGGLNCDQFGDCASPRFNILQLTDPQQGVAGLQKNILFTFAPPAEETPSPQGSR